MLYEIIVVATLRFCWCSQMEVGPCIFRIVEIVVQHDLFQYVV